MTFKTIRKMLLALGLGFTLQASAAPVLFDPDGPGPEQAINVASFDWTQSSALTVGGNQAVKNFLAGTGPYTFDVLSHAKLIGTRDELGNINTPAGLNTAYEVTMVMGLKAEVIGVLGTNPQFVSIKVLPGQPSFLRWYHDAALDANNLAGTGFGNGSNILQGVLTGVQASSIYLTYQTGSGLLDQSSNGDQWSGQQTVGGNGNYPLLPFSGTSFNGVFIKTGVSELVYSNFSLSLPYDSVDPSKSFVGFGGNVVPNIGAINGSNASGGPDVLYQSDYNNGASACSGRIGDIAWHDLNRNGIQDAGEPGIDGIGITLKDGAGSIIATTTTAVGPLGQQGYYQFTGLCAGDYYVEAETPIGFSPTASFQGGDLTIDSNGSPAAVNLPASNSSNQTIDFGYITPCTGSLGDFVWHDSNRNGIQDAGEPGIPNVALVLKDANGNVIATTTTNASGYYQFLGLCAGTYTVAVDETTLPAGFSPTVSNAPGSNPANDSNGSPADVTLPADNSSDQTIDFGYITPCTGTIGDFVWHDLNRNGIQDPGEPGIQGVAVSLLDANGNVMATTITGANGYYLFSGLCAGDYTVTADTPSGYSPTASQVGGNPATDSNGSPAPVNLPDDNSSDQTIDFGFITPCTGSIGDFVWHDLNRNGIQDAGEPGISGVTVYLRNPADNSLLATTTTNGSGWYQFTGLCMGSYKVEVATPAGYTPSPSLQGGNTALDSNGSPTTVSLPADNSSNQTIDFGFYTPCSGKVGDFVWHDLNRNGIQDAGEPGISGVTVYLRNPADNSLLATTTTNASGWYQFMGLCAGDYKIEVATPAGYTPSPSLQGGNTAQDSNGSPTTVNLPANNSTDLTIDFGFYTMGGGGQGCTPGYWKQPQHFGSWVGYKTTDLFSSVFGVTPTFKANLTLLEALGANGGGEKALVRHAVAALLNAANPKVNYFTDVAGVIALVQQAYATGDFETIKNRLDLENNRGCPLSKSCTYEPGGKPKSSHKSGWYETSGKKSGSHHKVSGKKYK